MTVRVVAAVVERNGAFLICQRPLHKRHGGLWEFPGGKVEEGESDFEAASRELAEELGVVVEEVGTVEYSRRDPGSHFVIEFLPVNIQGEPQCIEHAAFAWIAEHDLPSLNLAPSDREYVSHRLSSRTRCAD